MAFEVLYEAIPTNTFLVLLPLIVIIVIWEAIWKAIGLWKSARNDQIIWFICILIFNTAGILPIIYVFFFQRKGKKRKKKK